MLTVFSIEVNAQGRGGKAILRNVSSGLFWGAGNNGGTRASLLPYSEWQTLHWNASNNTYTLESQVSKGGDNFYFDGEYMDGQPVALTLTQKSSGYYTISNGDKYYGYSAEPGSYFGSYILGKNLSSSSTHALWEIIWENEEDDYWDRASTNTPIDVTYCIQNPNFGRNNRNTLAWVMDAANQNLCGGSDDNKCAESWQSAFTLSQTLRGMPNGIYCLTAQAALTDYTNIYDGYEYPVVYANDEMTPFNNMQGSDVGSNMNTLSISLAAGHYQVAPIYFIVNNGRITIGVRGTRTDTWCIWDNFRLNYCGPNVSVAISDATVPLPKQTVYNLNGQQVNVPGKGLYISNGRKVIIR